MTELFSLSSPNKVTLSSPLKPFQPHPFIFPNQDLFEIWRLKKIPSLCLKSATEEVSTMEEEPLDSGLQISLSSVVWKKPYNLITHLVSLKELSLSLFLEILIILFFP